MKNSISVSTKVFDELFTAVEVLGVDRTIQTLKDAKRNNYVSNDYNIEFIITIVSSVTDISKERILNRKDRTEERKVALSLCIFFIKEEFSYSYSLLESVFNVGASQLSRNCSLIKNVPKLPKTEIDKKISDYIKKVKILITEKKNKDEKI